MPRQPRSVTTTPNTIRGSAGRSHRLDHIARARQQRRTHARGRNDPLRPRGTTARTWEEEPRRTSARACVGRRASASVDRLLAFAIRKQQRGRAAPARADRARVLRGSNWTAGVQFLRSSGNWCMAPLRRSRPLDRTRFQSHRIDHVSNVGRRFPASAATRCSSRCSIRFACAASGGASGR